MYRGDKSHVISIGLFLPNNSTYIVLCSKYLIAQQLQLCLFIIINRDENYPPEASKDFAI